MMSLNKAYDEDKMEEILLKPFHYISSVRTYDFLVTKFTEAMNYWLRTPNDKLDQIKDITITFNNSIAMFDDVQDDTQFRRHIPTAHVVFGTPLALNCSFQLQLLGLEKILKLGHPKGSEVYCRLMLGFVRGQGTDIYWRENFIDVTHDHYKQMSSNKTGSILLIITELMQLFSENKTDFEYLVRIFTIFYQIRDDYCNLAKQELLEEGERISEMKKLNEITFCEDLTDGKLSWPIIHSLRSPYGDIIKGILKLRTRNMEVKKYVLSLLEQAGSLQNTLDMMNEMTKEIRTEIARLGGNPLLEDLLCDLQIREESSSETKAKN